MIADLSSSHDKDENLKLTPLQRREIIQKRKVHELVTLDKQEFKNDSELLAQLVELATPSYQDAHFVVAAALQRATTLYLVLSLRKSCPAVAHTYVPDSILLVMLPSMLDQQREVSDGTARRHHILARATHHS